ncbi:MAG: response regulator [Haloarculaceae archaeon]
MGDIIRVLVVDEDEDVLDLTETFLEREHDALVVETESDPEEAAVRVENDDIDCVVSDYRMPGMDGMDLFEAVRDQDPSLPFVLFSAAVDESTATEAEDAGVTAFVEKGIGTDHYSEIAATIENQVCR